MLTVTRIRLSLLNPRSTERTPRRPAHQKAGADESTSDSATSRTTNTLADGAPAIARRAALAVAQRGDEMSACGDVNAAEVR